MFRHLTDEFHLIGLLRLLSRECHRAERERLRLGDNVNKCSVVSCSVQHLRLKVVATCGIGPSRTAEAFRVDENNVRVR
jgi:RNA-binding protein YlmH